ncbi:MAG TPA: hypothetical protein VKB27_18675 [Gammaproteobacteria bacterium]|nr:hypothetical protein [Gammaproteobacteria bacterium]
MSQPDNTEATSETARLLTELDRALDESNVIRDIASKTQRLHDLERITGPTRFTRLLRREILVLENRLKLARA